MCFILAFYCMVLHVVHVVVHADKNAHMHLLTQVKRSMENVLTDTLVPFPVNVKKVGRYIPECFVNLLCFAFCFFVCIVMCVDVLRVFAPQPISYMLTSKRAHMYMHTADMYTYTNCKHRGRH